MAFWSWAFASPDKAVELADKVTSGIGSWIDEQQYTTEESAKDRQKREAQRTAMQLEMFKLFAKESTPRAITRRVIAIIVMGLYGIMFLFGNAVVLITLPRDQWLTAIIEFMQVMNFGTFCMMVMGTYFVYYGLNEVVKGVVKTRKPAPEETTHG